MYRKYRDSLFNIRYSYSGKKYRDVPVHRCIIAGLVLSTVKAGSHIYDASISTSTRKSMCEPEGHKHKHKPCTGSHIQCTFSCAHACACIIHGEPALNVIKDNTLTSTQTASQKLLSVCRPLVLVKMRRHQLRNTQLSLCLMGLRVSYCAGKGTGSC